MLEDVARPVDQLQRVVVDVAIRFVQEISVALNDGIQHDGTLFRGGSAIGEDDNVGGRRGVLAAARSAQGGDDGWRRVTAVRERWERPQVALLDGLFDDENAANQHQVRGDVVFVQGRVRVAAGHGQNFRTLFHHQNLGRGLVDGRALGDVKDAEEDSQGHAAGNVPLALPRDVQRIAARGGRSALGLGERVVSGGHRGVSCYSAAERGRGLS